MTLLAPGTPTRLFWSSSSRKAAGPSGCD